jgi:hypothetical protein
MAKLSTLILSALLATSASADFQILNIQNEAGGHLPLGVKAASQKEIANGNICNVAHITSGASVDVNTSGVNEVTTGTTFFFIKKGICRAARMDVWRQGDSWSAYRSRGDSRIQAQCYPTLEYKLCGNGNNWGWRVFQVFHCSSYLCK